MPFSRLVAVLYQRGVTYRLGADGALVMTGPRGVFTEALKAAIRAHKADLQVLCAGGVTIYGRRDEPAWLREELAQRPAIAGQGRLLLGAPVTAVGQGNRTLVAAPAAAPEVQP
jgi:hypothetical protein